MAKLRVRVRPNGKIETAYEGFVGNECFDHAKLLNIAAKKHGLELGEAESMQRLTPEAPLQPRVATKTGT
jgi:hypothetical protein